MTFLSTVEDVFQIEGRGCVIPLGLSESTPSLIYIRNRDPILLQRPEGSNIETFIQALEFLDGPNRRSCVPILLPPNITKADVSIGTDIWLSLDSETSNSTTAKSSPPASASTLRNSPETFTLTRGRTISNRQHLRPSAFSHASHSHMLRYELTIASLASASYLWR